MRRWFTPLLLAATLSGCAAMESVWDTTVSVFDSDTGETTEVALGDVVADTLESDGAGGIISTLMGANPLLAAAAGAAAAAAAAAARRKKKAAADEAAAPTKKAK